MKIVVLMKQVPDTWGERRLDPTTGIADRDASDKVVDEINERALEVALTYKDSHKDAEVVLVSMGPASATDVLRRGLSMGADSAVLITDDGLRGSDLLRTSAVLAAAVRRTGFDLVVAGNESTDGRGGVIPSMVAEQLGVPNLTVLDSITITDAAVNGERTSESGTVVAHATLPAVVSVTERTPEARFPSFKGVMTAKRKPLEVVTASDLAATGSAAASVILSVQERAARSTGTKVVDDGNAGVEIADFLAARRLI